MDDGDIIAQSKNRGSNQGTSLAEPLTVCLGELADPSYRKQQGATLYTIQLGLNLIWMPLFFKFKRPIEATVDIVCLTGVTGYLAYIWSQIDQVAAWGIAPYVGWLGFATYLSVSYRYQVAKSQANNTIRRVPDT